MNERTQPMFVAVTGTSMTGVRASLGSSRSYIYAAPFPVKTTAIVCRMIFRSMDTDLRAM